MGPHYKHKQTFKQIDMSTTGRSMLVWNRNLFSVMTRVSNLVHNAALVLVLLADLDICIEHCCEKITSQIYREKTDSYLMGYINIDLLKFTTHQSSAVLCNCLSNKYNLNSVFR